LLKNHLGEMGANSIVEVAKNKPHLITLCGLKPDQTSADFSKQGLGIGDAILLAFDLKKNSVLVDLNLKQNNLTYYGKDMSGIIQIAEALKVNKTLQSIDLAENYICLNGEMAGLNTLCEMLKVNTTLHSINLRYNNIDDNTKRQLREAAPQVTFTF